MFVVYFVHNSRNHRAGYDHFRLNVLSFWVISCATLDNYMLCTCCGRRGVV